MLSELAQIWKDAQMNGKLAIAEVAAAATVAMLLCAPANAADLSRAPYTKEPIPLMQPLYNWTGFYVGAHFGGAFSSEDVTAGGVSSFSTDPSGVLGGVQLGYNYQLSPNYLVGIEGELSWTSASGSATPAAGAVFTSNHNWYDTLDGKAGWVQGNWLFYAKLGFAWMNADYNLAGFSMASTMNATRVGFNVGAGAEFMIAPQWSAKLEYTFLDFGTDTYNFVAPVVGTSINTQVHEIKVGLNYHLPPGMLFGRW
jgi:opacity protein-like surface antigen